MWLMWFVVLEFMQPMGCTFAVGFWSKTTQICSAVLYSPWDLCGFIAKTSFAYLETNMVFLGFVTYMAALNIHFDQHCLFGIYGFNLSAQPGNICFVYL